MLRNSLPQQFFRLVSLPADARIPAPPEQHRQVVGGPLQAAPPPAPRGVRVLGNQVKVTNPRSGSSSSGLSSCARDECVARAGKSRFGQRDGPASEWRSRCLGQRRDQCPRDAFRLCSLPLHQQPTRQRQLDVGVTGRGRGRVLGEHPDPVSTCAAARFNCAS